jgi:hypothetical protein
MLKKWGEEECIKFKKLKLETLPSPFYSEL